MTQTMMAQPQATAVARPMDMLKTMLSAPSVQAQFQNALGEHKDTFVASLIDLYTGDASLQKCKPKAIIAEALRAATMHLPLNKALGFAYIVVFNNTVHNPDGSWTKVPTPSFIPGYKGYIQLAMRTGQYKTINADVVYEGELQGVDKLSGEVNFGGIRTSDKIVGYFAYFKLLNGFEKTLYMSVEEMATYAKRYSKGISKQTTAQQLLAKANEGEFSQKVGWEGNFNDMATKTVLRRLISKYGFMSVEMQGALAGDINAESKAQETKDAILAEEANKVDIPYEEVDTETGEIKTAENAPAEPEY